MATSRRVGNYATSANAVMRSSDQIFDAAMSNKPDFTKISKEAIKGRSLERRAVTKAEGDVASAGLDAFTKTNYAKMRADTAKKVEDIKRPARRMAGILGGLGTLAVTGSMYVQDKRDREEDKKLKAASDARFEQSQQEMLNAIKNMNSGSDSSSEIPSLPELPPMPELSSGSSSSSSSTSSSSGGTSNTTYTPGETSMSYMRKLTEQGLSPVQAAATVGHLVVETGNFRHLEELAPNRHGTRGYGHLQWTDPKPGRGRRTDFTNWSAQHGLKPSSLEANQGFLLHEMKSNFNNSWTGGGSWDGFKQMNSMEAASSYLHRNYIRPSAGSEQRRINEGNRILTDWNRLNAK